MDKTAIYTHLGISARTAATKHATKQDLVAIAELILSALPEKPAPPTPIDDDTYLTIASICRNTCVSYHQAKAVLAHQRNIGRIRSVTTGARVEYHLGDFKRNLTATPYKPRRRKLS